MKNRKKTVSIIFFLIILTNLIAQPVLGIRLDFNNQYFMNENSEIQAINQSNPLDDNKTLEEWKQFEQELLDSMYDDSWGYTEWRNFVIFFGYEIDQLSDEIINEHWVQNNIHIATLMKWGRFNKSLTEYELKELSDQMIFNTITLSGFEVGTINDAEIDFDFTVLINGPEIVVNVFIQGRSQTSNGHLWNPSGDHFKFMFYADVMFYDVGWYIPSVPPTPVIPPPGWPGTPYFFPNFNSWEYAEFTPFVENEVIFRCGCTSLWLGEAFIHINPNTITVDIEDDDSEPPEIHAFIFNRYMGINDPLYSKIILNNTLVDVSNITYEASGDWIIKVMVDDPSGVWWRKWPCPSEDDRIPLLSGGFEANLTAVYDHLDSNLIRFSVDFGDWDYDGRPGDSAATHFNFIICRYGYRDYSGNLIRIEGLGRHEGIFLSYSEMNQDFNSTCIFSYKENHRKNQVSVNIQLNNTENYPVRIKLGGLVPWLHNIDYKFVPNRSNLFNYTAISNLHIYDGNLYDPSDHLGSLGAIFSHDLKISPGTFDHSFHMWIELMPNEVKTVELLTVAPLDLRLLDSSKIITEDIIEGIGIALDWGLSGLKVLSGKTGGFMKNVPGWEDIKKLGNKAYVVYGLLNDFSDVYEDWSTLEYSQSISYGTMLGAFLPLYITILEAFSADTYWDKSLSEPEWWWHLDKEAGFYHFKKGDPNNKWLNIEKMLLLEDFWIVDENDSSLFYAGIGFIPTENQVNMVETILELEAGMSIFQLISSVVGKIPPLAWLPFVVDAICICIDIFKDTALLDIANGKDPPDLDYSSLPDQELIVFPYDVFPEFSEKIQDNDPIAIKCKTMIDTILELEKSSGDLITATNRYNTALNNSEFSACSLQIQNINNIVLDSMESSRVLDQVYVSLIREIEYQSNNDFFTLTEEEMQVIYSTEFEIDERCIKFLEYYENVRNVQTNISERIKTKIQSFNSIMPEYKDQLEKFAEIGNYAFESLERTSLKLLEENLKTNEFISVEKLGIIPSTDIETEENIDLLRSKLEELSGLILEEKYQSALLLAEEIKSESLIQYNKTLRNEFYSIFVTVEGFELFILQYNQIDLKVMDTPEKSVINGGVVEFSICIENVVGQGIKKSFNIINPTLKVEDLQEGVDYKIFFRELELDKNDQSIYYLPLSRNEVKNIKINFSIDQNSVLELQKIEPILKIQYMSSEKTLWNKVNLTINILDDDLTAPIISLEHTGELTDGNPGIIHFKILDSDIGSEATGTLSIIDDQGIIVYSNTFTEGIHNLDLRDITFLRIGEYSVILEAENNDEDGRLDDEEYSSKLITFILVDDDKTAPIININYIGTGLDESPGYFEWILIDYDDGIGGDHDSGFSIIDIKIIYESTEGLPTEIYNVLPSESGTWDLAPQLGIYTIIIIAQDNDDDRTLIIDSLSSENTKIQEIEDDDSFYPELSNLQIENRLEYIRIVFDVIEDTGLAEIIITIDGIEVIHDFPSILEIQFEYYVPNLWIHESGFHEVQIWLKDADNDRENDCLTKEIEANFIILDEDIKLFALLKVDQIMTLVMDSPCSAWYKNQRKETMINKLEALKTMIIDDQFQEAYEKLLQDVKPKLTGLKVDENNNPWDGGIYKNPWIIDPAYQEPFCLLCNEVLNALSSLNTPIDFQLNINKSVLSSELNIYNITSSLFIMIYIVNMLLLIGFIIYFYKPKNILN